MAAALVFHLPGARLDLENVEGDKCSIGPLTDPRCVLHPAEFRELVVTTGGLLESVMKLPGGVKGAFPKISLTIVMPGVNHMGGDVYRIKNDETISYIFVTTLPADVVDATLSGMKSRYPLEYGPWESASSDRPIINTSNSNEKVVPLSLISDEGLKVTMVVMNSDDNRDAICQEIVHKAASACVVAEMEYSVRGGPTE